MKNPYLEVIRGFAALEVFMAHVLMFFPVISSKPIFKLVGGYGHEAVIVFFMLSGIVIYISQSYKPKNKKEFILNRFKRIVPIYWLAILISLLAMYLIAQSEFPSIEKIFTSFLLLGNAHSIVSNGPIWSLTYEMIFYYLFALTIGINQKNKITIWFIAALGFLIVYLFTPGQSQKSFSILAVISYSIIWLFGYKLVEISRYINFSFRDSIFSFLLIIIVSRIDYLGKDYVIVNDLINSLLAAPIFIHVLNKTNNEAPAERPILFFLAGMYLILIFMLFLLSNADFNNKIIYSIVPAFYILSYYVFIKVDFNKINALLIKIGMYLGVISFSFYILHYPFLYLFSFKFHENQILGLLICVCIIFPLCFFLEKYYQPFLMRLLSKK